MKTRGLVSDKLHRLPFGSSRRLNSQLEGFPQNSLPAITATYMPGR
jgi:hypothetical protein